MLLDHKANPTIKDGSDSTPVQLALKNHHMELVKLLENAENHRRGQIALGAMLYGNAGARSPLRALMRTSLFEPKILRDVMKLAGVPIPKKDESKQRRSKRPRV